MSTVEPRAPGERFVLSGVSWETYVALRDAPENYHVRMTYDRGDLEMMSPSRRHEKFATLIDRIINAWAEEREIEIDSCRTMTCRRQDLARGFEPDDCYYVRHAAAMRPVEELDLSIHPPPDLAVEVQIARKKRGKLDLYAVFGVPEVWQYDGRSLQVHRLETGGHYAPAQASEVFGRFPLAEVERLLAQAGTIGEIALVKSFRQWIQANAGGSP